MVHDSSAWLRSHAQWSILVKSPNESCVKFQTLQKYLSLLRNIDKFNLMQTFEKKHYDIKLQENTAHTENNN